MPSYAYEIKIQADTPQEADKKMQALTTFARKLKTKTLLRLEVVIEKEPHNLALAEKFLGV